MLELSSGGGKVDFGGCPVAAAWLMSIRQLGGGISYCMRSFQSAPGLGSYVL